MFSMMMVGHLADVQNRYADVLADVQMMLSKQITADGSVKVKVPGTRPISSQLRAKHGKRHVVLVI